MGIVSAANSTLALLAPESSDLGDRGEGFDATFCWGGGGLEGRERSQGKWTGGLRDEERKARYGSAGTAGGRDAVKEGACAPLRSSIGKRKASIVFC